MENQQLVYREKKLTEEEIEERVARAQENIIKVRQDPKAMKKIDQLIADNS